MRNKFLIIGSQGSGKTTLAHRLEKFLTDEKTGKRPIIIDECSIAFLIGAITTFWIDKKSPIIICMQKDLFEKLKLDGLDDESKEHLNKYLVIINL